LSSLDPSIYTFIGSRTFAAVSLTFAVVNRTFPVSGEVLCSLLHLLFGSFVSSR
jgi:hypothetical protein